MRAAGLSDDAIRAAFAQFEPLPHRMQTVGVFGGVTWIDDSKATSIAALVAGVTMAASRFAGSVPKIHLIAGGLPKGDDPGLARECLSKWVGKVHLIGQCASQFEAAWHDVVPCEICGTLEQAVKSAAAAATDGDCVLLSPGTASFDQFKSYGDRGDTFCRCVLILQGSP
jgi:UDP-N-acetylmuramoylalanine--D-glutamate ligase